MNLKALVNNIQKSVNGVNNLNCGGCGVFAALVAKRLNKMGIPAVVRIGDYSADVNPKLLIDTIKSNNSFNTKILKRNGIKFDHFIVEITHNRRKYHLDSDFFHLANPITTNYNTQLYEGFLTPFQAMILAKDKYAWNRAFNRKQIPAMIKKLNEVFN